MDSIVIQVGGRHGRIAELARSRNGLLTVGRGFDNDLVLTDQHVAPRQLEISQSGEDWLMRVLDQTNPVLLNGEPVDDKPAIVNSGDCITVGRSRLSLYCANHPVEKTRPLVTSNWLFRESVSPVMAMLVLLAVCLIDFALDYQEASTTLKWEEQASNQLLGAIVILVWAGIWAVAGRILRHHANFSLQVMVTAVISLLSSLFILLGEYLAYPFHSVVVDEVMGWLLVFLILALLFRFNLLVATNIRNTTLAAASMAGLIVCASYAFVLFDKAEEFNAQPVFSGELKPPPLRIVLRSSIKDYLLELELLEVTLKMQASKD
jgi:pSer/pThr/pTyr-binding forkhead associated (FHA) protein